MVSDLIDQTYTTNKKPVNIMQSNAWKSSIENFKKILLYVKDTSLDVILEQDLPLANEKIDAVIIGKSPVGKLTAIIIEFKGWNFINPKSEDFVESDLGISLHPDYQLENYIGKLKFCHSSSNSYDYTGIISMYNLNEAKCKVEFRNKVFINGENKNFGYYINSLNISEASEEEIEIFLNGKYIQSNKLFEAIRENSDSIFNASRSALASSGFGLSEEQMNLINEIEEDIKNGNKITYLVQGSPGSGKTLLAISILLNSLSKNINSILTFKNNRLIECVRNVFNNLRDVNGNLLTAGGVIKYYSTGRDDNPGVTDSNYNGQHKVVIYDEAQRMNSENMRNLLRRGIVNIIFFDENQRLNYNERGTLENFRKIASNNGYLIKEYFLQGSYRVEGGMEYSDWLERFISNPEEIQNNNLWNQKYELKFIKSFDELYKELTNKRDSVTNTKVALIASFTETKGNMSNLLAIDNIRIGRDLLTDMDYYKKMRYNIYWLMKPQEYVDFWIIGECNELKNCASIYGTQGFEVDYAGFIWGRDFVIRNGKWEIGSHCEDFPSVARPDTLKYLIEQEADDPVKKEIAMTLLKNRLRIFLSRGIKGTYVFCEDDETRKFLIQNYVN
jgi:DUF2075 family protein